MYPTEGSTVGIKMAFSRSPLLAVSLIACSLLLLCPSAFLSAPSQRVGLGAAAATAALAPAAPAFAGEPPSVGIHWYWDLGIGNLHGEVAVVIFWVFFVLVVFAAAGAGGSSRKAA